MSTRKAAKAVVAGKPKKQTKPATARAKLDAAGTEAICDMLTQGDSFRVIAATYDVSISRLFEWIELDPERSQACARARVEAAQAYDDKALETLESADKETISVAREVAAHYRWRAKAANPKRYGDRTTVQGDSESPVEHRVRISFVDGKP